MGALQLAFQIFGATRFHNSFVPTLRRLGERPNHTDATYLPVLPSHYQHPATPRCENACMLVALSVNLHTATKRLSTQAASCSARTPTFRASAKVWLHPVSWHLLKVFETKSVLNAPDISLHCEPRRSCMYTSCRVRFFYPITASSTEYSLTQTSPCLSARQP